MKIKEGFVLRDVCGEKVIVAEGASTIDFGKLISVNETAAWLFGKAEELGDFTVAALAKALCSEYDVSEQQATADIEAIVGKWKEAGLLES